MRTKSVKFWANLLIILMCITTMTLFGYISSKSMATSIEEQYKQESESMLNQTVMTFEYQFSNVENTLEQLSQNLMSQRDLSDEDISATLNTYQLILPVKGTIIFGLENGEVYQGKIRNLPEEYNPVNQEWYSVAYENEREVNWTKPYLDYFTQEIVVSASKLVSGPFGEGVISIDFKLTELSKTISNSVVGEEGLVMLLNPNGTVLANRSNYLISQSIFGTQFKEMIEKTNSEHVPYIINNNEYLLRSGTIKNNNMSIVTAISRNELRSNLISSLIPILIAGLLCILIFSIITYVATLRWMRPLKKLGTIMNHVENGNYNIQAKVKDYEEVVRLSKGFNSMIRAIKKRDRDLMITNNELKQAEEKLRRKYDELKESQRIQRESEEKVAHLATHDSLTGLLNRSSLMDELNFSIKVDGEGKKAVIFIDLDNFKMINDTLGHSFGDQLIIKVSEQFKKISHLYKHVARISGDEFILVIHDIESERQAENIAKEIVGLFDKGIRMDSKIINVTVSIGVAIYPTHANSTEELLKLADMAMYRAKGSGKNGYRIFDEGIKKEVEEKSEIENGIRKSLETDGFELFFQPLFNAKEGRITSIEALLRTKSKELTKFSISRVIQTAEMTGQIVEIDKWVLKNACKAIKQINSTLKQPINISVNISPIHIMQQDFVDNICRVVNKSGIPYEWIELEITETSLMKSFELNLKKLEELKKLGISIHLDDFGTGYSSLSYLNILPIDRVKIDKSFVDVMLQSEKERKIIETIMNLAHNIGLQVVAEGVEKKEQFEILLQSDCELIQGYFISKPIPYEQIIVMLLENEVALV